MTEGDVSGNSLTEAHFSCGSHGNIPFHAEECHVTHGVSPSTGCSLRWNIFHSHLLISFWCMVGAAGWEQQRWEGTGEGTLLLPLGTASSSPPWESAAGNSLVWRSEILLAKGFQRQLLKESPCAKWSQYWRQSALKKGREKERKKKKLIH